MNLTSLQYISQPAKLKNLILLMGILLNELFKFKEIYNDILIIKDNELI
jgi:hypothetical protein